MPQSTVRRVRFARSLVIAAACGLSVLWSASTAHAQPADACGGAPVVSVPATVVGTGRHRIRELVEAQSRRRAAATGGESTIPLDAQTARTVQAQGWGLDDVLPEGEVLPVRRTANLHTGGTIHDVTAELHPALAQLAVEASQAIDIPVTGIDLIAESPRAATGVLIEANERPGLANHEPQPTAEAFVDLLFPTLRRRA